MTVPSSLNLYAYALNNPVKYTDPSGNIVIADDIFYLILGIGAVLVTTYDYINSPAGKKAINEGAVVIHKGMVFAGELTINTAISFVNWLFGTNSSAKDTKISFADMEYMVKVFQSSGYAVSLDSNDIYNFQIAMTKAKGEVATPCPAPANNKGKTEGAENNNGDKYKKPVSGKTGKEAAKDVPSWAKGNKPKTMENGNDFATRLCDEKYGKGNYPKGPGSEYNKIKKWGDRGFE